MLAKEDSTHLTILAAFEEWSHAYKAHVVVPHNNVVRVVSRGSEIVLKDCGVHVNRLVPVAGE